MEPLPRRVERADRPAGPAGARAAQRGEAVTGRGRPLVCVRCRRPITTEGDRIAIDGLHEHTQINPHGFIWSFGCFAEAPGCVPSGNPSREFAWFAGHTWQIAACGGCHLHLGWLFSSPDRRFHGLIVGRVMPGGPEGAGDRSS